MPTQPDQAAEPKGRKNLLLPNIARWPNAPDKPMIELKDIYLSFDDNHILRGFNLKIFSGQTTVVMGESGSGKSVILKLITGLIQPTSGDVIVFGRNLADLSTRDQLAMRKRMGMLFQNYALMDSISVRDNIAFPLAENTTLPEDTVSDNVRSLLDLFQLAHAYAMSPNSLSGGMKKRVGLARALITNPELVLLDEPTTGLDPVMIEFVDGLIKRAQQEYEVTSVVISHDIASVYRLADKVCMLQGGRIVEEGTPAEIKRSTHPWVSQFVGVGGSGRMKADTSTLNATDGADTAPCDNVLTRLEAEVGEPVVQVIDLVKTFGDRTVLKGVNLKIMPKTITVLIGGSGSGKSVIIKHIIGLFQPTAGRIKIFGEDVTEADTSTFQRIRARFGMLFQHSALFDSMSVRDNVGFPLLERRLARGKELTERVDEVLERLFIPDIAHKFPHEISAGQAKRVALARAMISKPDVMIYDEPTTGQDPIMIRNVDDMIEEAQEVFDLTSIVISHDMVSTFRIADRVAMLHLGRILAYGSPDELRHSRNDEVQKFIFAGSFGDK